MRDKTFIVAIVILMVMQFCMPSYAVFSFWFYLAIAVPTCYYAYKDLELWQDWRVKLLITLFIYVIIHAMFFYETLQTLRHSLTNAVFVIAMMLFHRHLRSEQLLQFIRLMLCVLIACGVASIVKYVIEPPEDGRLIPIGQNNHSILGANIYAAFALAGLCLWREANVKLLDKMLIVTAIMVALAIIVFSQSRGPLIAFCCTGVIALFLLRCYKVLAFVVAIIAIISTDMWLFYHGKQPILPLAPYYGLLLDALQRKSHRLEIWQLAWDLIRTRPITGYGLQANFPYGYAGVNPHNLFLATWYYTGVVGFGLLLLTTIAALANLYKNCRQPLGFIGFLLLINGVIACCTDQGQLMKTPSPLWFIFWWPIAISCVIALNNTNLAKSTSQPQP